LRARGSEFCDGLACEFTATKVAGSKYGQWLFFLRLGTAKRASTRWHNIPNRNDKPSNAPQWGRGKLNSPERYSWMAKPASPATAPNRTGVSITKTLGIMDSLLPFISNCAAENEDPSRPNRSTGPTMWAGPESHINGSMATTERAQMVSRIRK